MVSRLGVHALRVRSRQPCEDFDFAPGEAVAFSMRVAHHPPDPLDLERCSHMPLHILEHRLKVLFEVGIVAFNVGAVAHKTLYHDTILPAYGSGR